MITIQYYLCFLDYIYGNTLKTTKYFSDNLPAKTQIYSFYLTIKHFNDKHYRHNTLKKDLLLNLDNVYIPNTYIKFSYFCCNKFMLYVFFFFVFPILCFFDKGMKKQLTDPDDWFTYWRHNCMVNYHYYLHNSNTRQQFKNEDKYLFHENVLKNNIPTIPILKIPNLFIKHKNREGGLAIYSFKNAINNGDWIFQEKATNHKDIEKYLFKNSPLSTFRIVTTKNKVESCVFRIGLNNEDTDHNSVMYQINLKENKINKHITNNKWYNKKHINIKKKNLKNINLKFLNEAYKLCLRAHKKLMNNIPILGWDVAYTQEYGLVLVEVNISCNFFCGKFDKKQYFKYINKILI